VTKNRKNLQNIEKRQKFYKQYIILDIYNLQDSKNLAFFTAF